MRLLAEVMRVIPIERLFPERSPVRHRAAINVEELSSCLRALDDEASSARSMELWRANQELESCSRADEAEYALAKQFAQLERLCLLVCHAGADVSLCDSGRRLLIWFAAMEIVLPFTTFGREPGELRSESRGWRPSGRESSALFDEVDRLAECISPAGELVFSACESVGPSGVLRMYQLLGQELALELWGAAGLLPEAPDRGVGAQGVPNLARAEVRQAPRPVPRRPRDGTGDPGSVRLEAVLGKFGWMEHFRARCDDGSLVLARQLIAGFDGAETRRRLVGSVHRFGASRIAGIVPAERIIDAEEGYFVVGRYVALAPLADLATSPMSPPVVFWLVAQLSLRLAGLHDFTSRDHGAYLGIVHRNVALESVCIAANGAPVLGAIEGYSSFEEPDGPDQPWSTNRRAPESADGHAVPASDVYALGMLAFRLLAGQSGLDRVAKDLGRRADAPEEHDAMVRLRLDDLRLAADQAALLEDMLRREAWRRPTAAEVARLAGATSPNGVSSPPESWSDACRAAVSRRENEVSRPLDSVIRARPAGPPPRPHRAPQPRSRPHPRVAFAVDRAEDLEANPAAEAWRLDARRNIAISACVMLLLISLLAVLVGSC